MMLKLKLVEFILRRWGYLLIATDGSESAVLGGENYNEIIIETLYRAIQDADWVKGIVLKAAEKYLAEREVETKIFIDKIK